MKVILFASSLNPLSAVVAEYLKARNELELIVTAPKSCYKIRGGLVYVISLAALVAYRYINVFFRMVGIKRSKNYASLLEFMVENSNIPYIKFQKEGDMNLPCNDDLFVISCIFPTKIPYGFYNGIKAINIHPGKLPDYAGPNPYFWTLANNEKETALTFHLISDKFDNGDILHIEKFATGKIKSEYSLEKKCSQVLKDALPSFFVNLEHRLQNRMKQNQVRYFKHPDFKDRLKYLRLSVF